MYPREELTILASRKAVLLERIHGRRLTCAAAATRAARPIAMLDRGMARWRRLSPLVKFAAVPVAFLLKRTVGRRARKLGTLVKWGPVVFAAVRGMAGARGLSRRS